MTRTRLTPLFAWLCLMWFGLSNTLFTGGIVVCRDGHGGTRIEWGCNRNASDECATSCGSEESEPGSIPAHPCDDTPLKGDHELSKAPPRITGDFYVAAIPAALTTGVDASLWPAAAPEHARPQRPPDTLQRLRSVILLV